MCLELPQFLLLYVSRIWNDRTNFQHEDPEKGSSPFLRNVCYAHRRIYSVIIQKTTVSILTATIKLYLPSFDHINFRLKVESFKQEVQCMYNVILRRVRVTTFAVEKR